jgi:hypothetical protein
MPNNQSVALLLDSFIQNMEAIIAETPVVRA